MSEVFAKLAGVEYVKEGDRVFVKFGVFDSKYKEFALQVGSRDDVSLTIRGEYLEIDEEDKTDED